MITNDVKTNYSIEEPIDYDKHVHRVYHDIDDLFTMMEEFLPSFQKPALIEEELASTGALISTYGEASLKNKIRGDFVKSKMKDSSVIKRVYKFSDASGDYFIKIANKDWELSKRNVTNMILLDKHVGLPSFYVEEYENKIITVNKAETGTTLDKYLRYNIDYDQDTNVDKVMELTAKLLSKIEDIRDDSLDDLSNYLNKIEGINIKPVNKKGFTVYFDSNPRNFFVITDGKNNPLKVIPIDFDYLHKCSIPLTSYYALRMFKQFSAGHEKILEEYLPYDLKTRPKMELIKEGEVIKGIITDEDNSFEGFSEVDYQVRQNLFDEYFNMGKYDDYPDEEVYKMMDDEYDDWLKHYESVENDIAKNNRDNFDIVDKDIADKYCRGLRKITIARGIYSPEEVKEIENLIADFSKAVREGDYDKRFDIEVELGTRISPYEVDE